MILSHLKLSFFEIKYILLFLVVNILFIITARLIKIYFKDIATGTLILTLWGLFSCLIYATDYFGLRKLFFWIPFFLVFLIFYIYTFLKKRDVLLNKIKDKTEWTNILKCLIIWFVPLLIAFLPLLVVLPRDTTITGYYVNNDSVIHALLSKGFEYTRHIISLPAYYNQTYPRGFHSYNYYMNFLTQNDPKDTLIVATLLFYSLISYTFWGFLERKKYSFLKKLLITTIPSSSFLVIVCAYNLYVAQIVAIPFLLASLLISVDRSINLTKPFNIIIFLILTLSVFNIYGLLALIIIIAGLIVRYLSYIYENRLDLKKSINIKETFKSINIASILILVIILFLSLPAFLTNTSLLINQRSGSIEGGLLTSIGNLPDGFLSPFHLTGFWYHKIPFREMPALTTSKFAYLFLIILMLQLFVIFKSLKNKVIICALGILLLTNILAIFLVNNQYIHLKYFTFTIPLFLFTFCISLVEYFRNLKANRIISLILLTLFLVSMTYSWLKYYKNVGVYYNFQFDALTQLDKDYIQKGSTLVLTKEDWFEYYLNQSDDYAPLTLYISKNYNNTKLDYIIIDKAYADDIKIYLSSNAFVTKIINNTQERCINKSTRYDVYDLNCK